MLGISTRIFFFSILEFILVKCEIPSMNTLSVRQVDTQLIAQKRMDTLEMCRIFENERLKQNAKTDGNKRFKREIAEPKFGGAPTLREEDVRRVESIVDKLYDDLTENGRPVTYRQREVETTAKVEEKLNEGLFNSSGRRFDFAPAFLLGPETPDCVPPDTETIPVPWIKKWKHGIIPYFIDPKTYDNGLAEVIMKAFDYFERATCIRLQRLREKPIDKQSMEKVEWVYISNPMGIRQCVHSNERIPNKGVQMVVFGYDCLSTGEIVHEVMHVLGFSHEHTRPDRDQHVSIVWDNVKPGYKKYFLLRTEDPLQWLPYDYASVLHYPPRAFSKNGQITVSAKVGVKLGQREGLSETDVEKVALIFGNECVDRNKEYLLTTCPSVVKNKTATQVASQQEIQQYFKDRLWSYGIVNYKLRDEIEFSVEEKQNIQAVIKHIEKETCIEFRDITEEEKAEMEEEEKYADEEVEADGKKESADENKSSDKKNHTQNNSSQPKEEEINVIDGPEHVVDEGTQKYQEENIKNDQTGLIGTIVSLEVDPGVGENLLNKTRKARVKRSPKLTKAKAYARRYAKTPKRRHAGSVLVFTRSTETGCKCPTPGKPQGDSTIELSADCFNSVNDLLHVFVHILGLDHQHNMHDRDDFLHIVWEKLTPDVKNDMKQKLPPAAAAGFPYDYQSVMHYPWLQIKNGVTNIMYPIWNDGWAMGHWQGLSSTDVQKLSLLYFEQCLDRKKLEDTAEGEK